MRSLNVMEIDCVSGGGWWTVVKDIATAIGMAAAAKQTLEEFMNTSCPGDDSRTDPLGNRY